MTKRRQELFKEAERLLAVDLTAYKVNKNIHDGYWLIGQRCIPFLEELKDAKVEYLIIFYINGQDIEKEVVNIGDEHEVYWPKTYTCKDAPFWVIAHNHPPKKVKEFLMPSEPDNDLTRWVQQMAFSKGSVLCDHLIVGEDGIYSHREHGWIL